MVNHKTDYFILKPFISLNLDCIKMLLMNMKNAIILVVNLIKRKIDFRG